MDPSGELFEFKAAFKAARRWAQPSATRITCAPEGGYAGGHGEGGAAVRLSGFGPIHMLAVFFEPNPIVPIQFSDDTPLDQIDLPSGLRNALEVEGVKTVWRGPEHARCRSGELPEPRRRLRSPSESIIRSFAKRPPSKR